MNMLFIVIVVILLGLLLGAVYLYAREIQHHDGMFVDCMRLGRELEDCQRALKNAEETCEQQQRHIQELEAAARGKPS